MFKFIAALIYLPIGLAMLLAPENVRADEVVAQQDELNSQWGHFAPKGWRVLQIAKGSVLAPKSDDVVVVVEEQDPAKTITNDGMGETVLNTNARALLLLAKNGQTYQVKARFDGFLPNGGDPENRCLADPLSEGKGVSIAKGVVSINLHYWYSCGSWYVTSNDYKFRAEKGRLRLIDIESWSLHRASGMGSRTSINYLTGRKNYIENVTDLGPEPELLKGEDMPKQVVTRTKVDRQRFYLDSMNRAACTDFESAPSWCGI
jgi:hypothetical protein